MQFEADPCTLYDVGNQDGIDFIVMEYIEGETLAERLEKGALPLDEALLYGIQIADGLDTAHRAGIVHRDLKPANAILTKSGIKLLDFGLARLLDEAIDSETSDAPTKHRNLTEEHAIIGTLQYMAPEQLERKPADARTDIFAFGAVLYEMITGKKAFEGTSQAILIAAIIERTSAPISQVEASVPSGLDRIIKRCLAKDPNERWQTTRDLLAEFKWVAEGGAEADARPTTTAPSTRRERVAWAGAGLFLGALIAGGAVWGLIPSPSPPSTTRFTITLPVPLGGSSSLRVSPDSKMIAYSVRPDAEGDRQIHLRAFDSFETTLVPGTENARAPFFSPDSQWIAFFANNQLQKVSVAGGAPIQICDAPGRVGSKSGTWGPDDTIVFHSSTTSGLMGVPAAGGTPELLTEHDADRGETEFLSPRFLPDGRGILLNIITTDGPNAGILDLDTGERRILVAGGSRPQYAETGHLVYSYASGMMAMAFDLASRRVSGSPIPILNDVRTSGTAGAYISISKGGAMAYVPGTGAAEAPVQLVWVDRDGRSSPVVEDRAVYGYPRVSPDGQAIAVTIGFEVWVYDVERGTRIRLTNEGDSIFPAWTPDGSRVTFASRPAGTGISGLDLAWAPADGSGRPEVLLERDGGQAPMAWSPDGRLSFFDADADSKGDIWTLPVDGEPSALLSEPFAEYNHDVSPDGAWLAYESNESGQFEIYLQPYPDLGAKRAISAGGGRQPVWSADRRELFYRSGDQMMVVDVQHEPPFTTSRPRVLFEGSYLLGANSGRNYDVSPDGQRFVMVQAQQSAGSGSPEIRVVLNWFDELRRRLPTDN